MPPSDSTFEGGERGGMNRDKSKMPFISLLSIAVGLRERTWGEKPKSGETWWSRLVPCDCFGASSAQEETDDVPR